MDLSALSDWELAEVARERELAYQATLAEIDRRKHEAAPDKRAFDEKTIAAYLARRRNGEPPDWRLRADNLPPPMFRLGYEWCALTMVEVLESCMVSPSSEAVSLEDMEPVGRGLYRPTGKRKLFDVRRRGALALLEELESFFANRQKFMLFVMPPRRTAYKPDDDQEALGVMAEKPGVSSAVLGTQ